MGRGIPYDFPNMPPPPLVGLSDILTPVSFLRKSLAPPEYSYLHIAGSIFLVWWRDSHMTPVYMNFSIWLYIERFLPDTKYKMFTSMNEVYQ